MSLIRLQGVCLAFPESLCLDDVHLTLQWGQRVAIVGDNGSGKSSLLRLLLGELAPDAGSVRRDAALRLGYLPQCLPQDCSLSGGEAVERALSAALGEQPDLLLLDEPGNHLDSDRRRALISRLNRFYGTLAMVSHDAELIDAVCDTVWHMADGRVRVFNGSYQDYLRELAQGRTAQGREMQLLKREAQALHAARMAEQERAGKARLHGARSIAQRKWATVRSPAKLGRGNETAGRQQAVLRERRQQLARQISENAAPPVVTPRFHFAAASQGKRVIVQISNGELAFERVLLSKLYLGLRTGERLALAGRNGSGKSTLASVLAGRPTDCAVSGEWLLPEASTVAYLDQHLADLQPDDTVLSTLERHTPAWAMAQRRQHLADFLFREGGEAGRRVAVLSGGERVRLALACVAAKVPALLILDEVGNHLDARTRAHVIEVLRDYPGALLLISHDEAFLDAVGGVRRYRLGA